MWFEIQGIRGAPADRARNSGPGSPGSSGGKLLRKTEKIAHLIRSRCEITPIYSPDDSEFRGAAFKIEYRVTVLFCSAHFPGKQGWNRLSAARAKIGSLGDICVAGRLREEKGKCPVKLLCDVLKLTEGGASAPGLKLGDAVLTDTRSPGKLIPFDKHGFARPSKSGAIDRCVCRGSGLLLPSALFADNPYAAISASVYRRHDEADRVVGAPVGLSPAGCTTCADRTCASLRPIAAGRAKAFLVIRSAPSGDRVRGAAFSAGLRYEMTHYVDRAARGRCSPTCCRLLAGEAGALDESGPAVTLGRGDDGFVSGGGLGD